MVEEDEQFDEMDEEDWLHAGVRGGLVVVLVVEEELQHNIVGEYSDS